MHRIKVTGYIAIDDDEYDDGPLGPLTEEAFNDFSERLTGLEDMEFEVDSE